MGEPTDGLQEQDYDIDSEPWFARTVGLVPLTPAEAAALLADKKYLAVRLKEIRTQKKAAAAGRQLTRAEKDELRTLKRRAAVLFADLRAKNRIVAKHRLYTGEPLAPYLREAMGRTLILWQLAAWARCLIERVARHASS